jgi:dipeptidyl-peptidase-4
MKKQILTTALIILSNLILFSQTKPLTVAESSNFESTSRYEDVMKFIDQLKSSSPYIRVETIATTNEGRDIPLMVIGNPLPQSPEDLHNDNRVVVYVQANIHSGEVEGKEASLMFARDLLADKKSKILEDVIILICPDLNADGNERISTQNRRSQNGPVNGVGVRYNAQQLDLNRDAMKVETPEMQGVIQNVFVRWDPAVTMDCHTTNGSYHEEPVTFTWIMNPNGDRSLINYMRDEMMPEMSNHLREEYKTENCFYGEFIDRGNIDKGWISYAAAPRYMSNYIGVRNRLGILNENYVYADYKTRVYGAYHLIKSLVDYSAEHKTEIKELINKVDASMTKIDEVVKDSFAIKYKGQATPEKITIKAFEAELIGEIDGWKRYKKTDIKRTVTVPYIADYYATESTVFPYAYVINIPEVKVIDLLKTHGIKIEKLSEKISLEVDRFKIAELQASKRLNQGHYTQNIKGEFEKDTIEFSQGTYIVRTSQVLGNVVAYLLEPQADDGMLVWNYFDRYLAPQWGRRYYPYPVYKVLNPIDLKTEVLK